MTILIIAVTVIITTGVNVLFFVGKIQDKNNEIEEYKEENKILQELNDKTFKDYMDFVKTSNELENTLNEEYNIIKRLNSANQGWNVKYRKTIEKLKKEIDKLEKKVKGQWKLEKGFDILSEENTKLKEIINKKIKGAID